MCRPGKMHEQVLIDDLRVDCVSKEVVTDTFN